ncbi:MAG: hypothetical protein DVB25_07210 [Verrucomicrobia bacterium]|nr:MAG: hypothetical protein DVB25_07210 [Verrucomicrobiota bacterium]
MKPYRLQFSNVNPAAFITALALLTAHVTATTPIVGDTVNTNLTVAGWGAFANGVDLGRNGELLLNWLPSDAANPLGTATCDISLAQGTFLWRDSITPAPTARNKMRLDSSNNLTLYLSDGSAGLLLEPENGKISVLATGTNSGIFFGTNTLPTLQAAANGSAIFPSQVTLQSGLLLTNGSLQVNAITPATSSSTGALTVAGGIAGGLDAYFNGVRVGRGAGNISTNTVSGTWALGSNTTGYANTASGAYALRANTTGGYNTATGPYALYANTTGGYNTATGPYVLRSNTTGSYNLATGPFALYANTTGSSNIALGYYALYSNASGSNNIALGNNAAYYQANGSTVLTKSQSSIYIGAYVKGKDNNDSNSIVIGSNAVGEGANTTVIGNSTTTKTHLYGELVANTASIGGYPVLTAKSGIYSTLTNSATLALGNYSSATQQGAIAIGQSSQATMYSALALGDYSYAGNIYATAIQGSCASGLESFAANHGYAMGAYSLAMTYGEAYGLASLAIGGLDKYTGQSNCALGIGSVALGGRMNQASGDYAYALGNRVTASSAYCFAVGSQNLSASNSITAIGTTGWLEDSALLEVGNGNPNATAFETSNAITTLKNGQTTLTNKAWKANITAPLADPDPITDSGGNALVVEGHTVLKGKVVIEHAQGDIAMGIYGDN